MTRSLVTLRTATPADAPDLADLWTDVVRRVGREDQVGDLRQVISRVDASTDERVVVAEYDGEFAGAVHLQATTMSG